MYWGLPLFLFFGLCNQSIISVSLNEVMLSWNNGRHLHASHLENKIGKKIKTHTYTYPQAHTHTCMSAGTHTDTPHVCKHTHTHTHTHTHIHTHTYTHIQTHTPVVDPGFESRGGGGGAWNSKTPKLVIATRSRRGPALAPCRGSGGMLPREILKIGMRRYAFFTILGYNFRKIRERICKVICTYIYNFYKIFEVTGKIRKIKKKMFNMK